MMAVLREWLLGITGAAILAAFADSLMPEGGVKRVGKLVCGLVLIVAVLRPLNGLAVPAWKSTVGENVRQMAAQQLKEEANGQMRAVIEEELAAYSMDKAAQLGVACRVQVTCTLGEDGIFLPQLVLIQGVSREEGGPLAQVLQQELGLRGEQIQFQKGEEP